MFNEFCNRIDTSFSNSLSVDAICVYGSYVVITWITYNVYALGCYGYRILLGKVKECLLVSIVTSVLLGALVWGFSNDIPHLFELTEVQHSLFSSCLCVLAVILPFMAIGDFLQYYMLLQCRNKVLFVNDAIFWGIMIIGDILVTKRGCSLPWLIVTTGIAYAVYSVTLAISSGILKEKFEPDVQTFISIVKHGLNFCCDRLTGKVATIVFSTYASKLGTELYAIHAICFDVGIFTQGFSNSMELFQLTRLAKCDPDTRWKACKSNIRRYGGMLIVLAFAIAPLVLVFTHGKVNYSACIVFALLETTQVIPLIFFNSYKAFVTIEKQTKYLKYGGIIGMFVRIPFVLVCYSANFGLWGFSIACTFDFIIRMLYFYICSLKIVKEQKANGLGGGSSCH